MRRRTLPVIRDDRGVLVAIESDALDFVPRRVFIVSEVPAATLRGDHRVPCRQTMVLCSGRADVELTGVDDRLVGTFALTETGDAVDLHPGDYVRYRLSSESASIIVFAAEPYRPPRGDER